MQSRKSSRYIIHLLLAAAASTAAAAAQAPKIAIARDDLPTRGNPTSAIATRDGRFVFVSVTNVDAPNFSGPDSAAGTRKDVVSGIQIFERRRSLLNHTRRLKPAGFIRTGSAGANGLAFVNGEKTLVVGVGDEGVAFLDVQSLLHGNVTPAIVSQGDSAGTFDVVASPDGKYVFSANEYGIVDGQRGSVGVIAVNVDASGSVIHPQLIRRIPVGDVVPSLTLSPDGSRLYVATELVPSAGNPAIAGSGNPVLTKHDCVQKKGTRPRGNGFITVIDTQRAVGSPNYGIISRVAAGCSPVRLVENASSSALFVSARGDDAILAFSPRLLESDPEHALLRVVPSGGTAPVGMRLFAQDALLLVANSNRFADEKGTVAVLDVSGIANGTPKAPVISWEAGAFPRNIEISSDGRALYLTNYTSRSLEVINIRRRR